MSAAAIELTAALKEDTHHLYHGNASNEINMVFMSEIRPISWYSLNPVRFTAQMGVEEIRYTPPMGYEYLLYNQHTAKFPELWVKPEHADVVQFCWCSDIGYQITPSATFTIDDVEVETLDAHFNIAHEEWFGDSAFEKSHKIDVGNDESVIEWGIHHSAFSTQPIQPWFYSNDPSSAFPLFRLKSTAQVVHVFKHNLNLENLIRMRRRVGEAWVYMAKPDLDLLGGLPNGNMIKPPELWGCFGKIRDMEIEYEQCQRNSITMYIDNVIVADAKDAVGFNRPSSVSLNSVSPCKAILFMSENVNATEINNHSNYGSDIHDVRGGKTPIYTTSLKYGSSTYKFKDLESSHFTGAMARYHFNNSPRRPGILAYAFVYRPATIGIDPGVKLGHDGNGVIAELMCRFEDPEISNNRHLISSATSSSSSSSSSRADAEERPNFHLRCRLIVTRELKIGWKTGTSIEFGF